MWIISFSIYKSSIEKQILHLEQDMMDCGDDLLKLQDLYNQKQTLEEEYEVLFDELERASEWNALWNIQIIRYCVIVTIQTRFIWYFIV